MWSEIAMDAIWPVCSLAPLPGRPSPETSSSAGPMPFGPVAFGGVAHNTRFLILPWVRVPHLASHLLAIIMKRISADWQHKYGHPLHLIETFVERDRFRGTCYQAANWKLVGQTTGRSRQDRYSTMRVPVKDIYLYPLTPRLRELLCHEDRR